MAGNSDVTKPAVQAVIAAINAGDRAAFFAPLTPGATMSDDGTDRDLAAWADRGIFTGHDLSFTRHGWAAAPFALLD